MGRLSLSEIRTRAIAVGRNEWGPDLNEESAVSHPYSFGALDGFGVNITEQGFRFSDHLIPLVRFSTCEHTLNEFEPLPLLPAEIPKDAKQGQVFTINGTGYMVIENMDDVFKDMTLASLEFVDPEL